MPLTATGFPGSVNSIEMASMARGFGSEHEVDGPTDYKVIIPGTGERTVRIEPGVAHAGGVRVVNDAPMTLQLGTIAAGGRWDLVCLRRTWTAPGTVALTSVAGTVSRSLPAGMNTTLGAVHDQPLALVKLSAGTLQPVDIIDLRLIASKVYTAADILALPRKVGVEAVVDRIRYRYVDVGGNPVLLPVDVPLLDTVLGGAAVSNPVDPGRTGTLMILPLRADQGRRPPRGILNVTLTTKIVGREPASAGDVWCETEAGVSPARHAQQRWHYESTHSAIVTFQMRVPVTGVDINLVVKGSVDGGTAAPVVFGQPRVSLQTETYGGL